jgi:tripartite-type tricarboxylate transporter receptor subunit TctC
MKTIKRRTFLLGGAALAAGAQGLRPGAAWAQGAGDYPARPIRFIVPLAAGGGLDFIARLIADPIGRSIGQQVVVENRTGAGGTIGIEAVIKAPPDGYTVLITNDNVASAPHVQQLPKDFTKDLVPVSQLTRQPQSLSAHSSLGVNSMAELLKLAKEQPGQGVATSGVGSNQHVLLATLMQATGVKFTHVPYRGAGQAISDLVGGQIKLGVLGPAAVMPHAKAGTLRLLAQSGRKRSSSMPDTPTLTELGIDVVVESWFAAFVPVGTPPAIVAKLNAEFDKAMVNPTVQERLGQAATEAVGGPPDLLAKQYAEAHAHYARAVKELGITAK